RGDTGLVGLLRRTRGRHRHDRSVGVLRGRRARGPDRTMRAQHHVAAVTLAAFLAVTVTLPAAHADTAAPDPGEPTAEQLAAAVTSYRPEGSVLSFEPEVLTLGTEATEDGETTVTL